MSIVSLININVLNNPAPFNAPYKFEITFECLEQLKQGMSIKSHYILTFITNPLLLTHTLNRLGMEADLRGIIHLVSKWDQSRLIYVCGPNPNIVCRFEHDQELDSLLVGPVPVGINKFVFEADPPSPDLIPVSELVSVTVILLSCSYNGKEFVRVGYYVNNEYDTEELRENPPSKVAVDHIVRNVLAEKPRVTRFNIVWDNEGPEEEFPPEQPEADNAADDEEQYGAEDEDDEDEDGDEEAEEEDEDVEMEDPDAKPAAIEEGEEDIENSEDEDEELDDAPPLVPFMQHV